MLNLTIGAVYGASFVVCYYYMCVDGRYDEIVNQIALKTIRPGNNAYNCKTLFFFIPWIPVLNTIAALDDLGFFNSSLPRHDAHS